MSYPETISYLFAQLPMFHRIGPAAYKANLDNIIAISKLIGDPQKNFKSVHVAGTNGKGSVSNMLSSIFMEAGYKTGLFTSPHLKDFRERIRVNGQMIEEDTVVRFVETYREIFDDIKPSFFEWSTALAFDYFSQQDVDVAIIETGLGGRLDSTNIITPELAIITNISFDHMYLLGDTLEKIGGEKAGIIKEGVPVVVGERGEETDEVFKSKAEQMHSKLFFASDVFSVNKKTSNEAGQVFEVMKNERVYIPDLLVSLQGNYQQKNICTVAQSFEILKQEFDKLELESLVRGVARIQQNTGLRGRWDILSQAPLIIADIAHNEAGIGYSVRQLEELMSKRTGAKLHMVYGMVKDKDVDHVLSLLPKDAIYYFCQPDLPRALEVDVLFSKANALALKGVMFDSVNNAFIAAKMNASIEDVIYVGGSTFVVSEVL